MRNPAGFLLAAFCAAGVSSAVAADELADLVVPAGETLTVTANAAYQTITVNGTLVLEGGKLTAREVRVGDGEGADGALEINGGELDVSISGDYVTMNTLYIGYNGGKGTVTVNKSVHTVRRTVLGHGGGNGSSLVLNSGGISSYSVQKWGSGESTVFFNAGRFELSGSSLISLNEGTLIFDATKENAQIRLYRDGSTVFFNTDETHTGKLVTKGAQKMYLYYSDKSEKGYISLNSLADGRLNWGHTGGFLLYGHEASGERFHGRFQMADGAFFAQGRLQSVTMYENQSLDVNGQRVRMNELLFKKEGKGSLARIWNSAAGEGAIVLGTNSASKVSVVKDCTWEHNVALVKTETSKLRLDLSPFDAPIAVEGGILEITNRVSVSNIAQTADGKIHLTQTGRLEFRGKTWENPSFADDSAGVIASLAEAGCTNLMDAKEIDFKGNSLEVGTGRLELGKLGEISDRYFRFTLKRSYVTTPEIAELSELQLLDSQGGFLSLGLVKVADGTEAKDLQPGQCAYKSTYVEGYNTTLEGLFDGDTNTTMYVKDVAAYGPENDYFYVEPVVVHFRLPETALAPAVAYSMRKGNDTNPSRNLTVWSLESSPDGIHWELVDERSLTKYEDQSLVPHSEYKQSPFKFKRALGALESLNFGENAYVEISPGADLDARAKAGGISVLRLDVQEYSSPATISSFPAAEGGKLYLENAALGNGRTALPVKVGALGGNLKSWTAYADNVLRADCSLVVDRAGNLVLKCAPFHIILR